MESKHGRFDNMEERIHPGSLRQKSKVPRARYQQRCEYSEFTEHRNGSLKNSPGFHQSTSHQTTTHQADTDEYKEWQRLIGERVCISGVKQGVLRYYGRTNFAQGFWCGVELDEPVGKNNGTVNGIIYFSCKQNHGIFAPVSKVSRLNDLCIDWRTEIRKDSFTRQQEQCQSSSNWDFNLRYGTESIDSPFLKNSPSDPSFMRPAHRASLPHKSESFPYDKRSITEQRECHSFSVNDRNYEMSEVASKCAKGQGGSKSSKNPSFVLSKYGYGAKNQFFSSNVVCLGDKSDVCESVRDQYVSRSEQQNVPKKVTVKTSSKTFEKHPMEDCEHFHQTPTNSGEASPMSAEPKRFNDIGFFEYKMPEDLLNAFQSRDFPDPEDEMDNDDQMSVDYDESLGILTPSQMKDFTLCPDLPTSCSDIGGMDFPSSESFDDINDLPEDEQVHDVSVKYLPESSSAKRVLEVAKKIGVGNFGNSEVKTKDSELDSMVSSTDKFLFSISQKTFEDFNLDSHYLSNSDISHSSSSKQYDNSVKLNNLSANNVLGDTRTLEKELPEKLNLGLESYTTICTKETVLATNAFNPSSAAEATFSQFSVLATEHMADKVAHDESHNLSDSNKIALRNFAEVDVCRKNYDTDSGRDSLLQNESEHNSTLKEKLTVSWEDCVTQANDCMFTPVERPESVYTVASSDTGFQEDTEIDADGGMATSMDSTEDNKRFSTTSRDSCIVTEEVDGYKLAESNSTSGYSTGLSDSCCNDRAEDDMSSKRLTDEEIQDSVGPCDSEDAFSFHENSLSKDCELGTAEMSDITVETVTALCHDSTSDALCETMVEDATLTEINELLMSPEDNQKVIENKENDAAQMDQAKDVISECSSIKTSDRTTSSISAMSTPKSTPEKQLNANRSAQRNQRAPINRNVKSPRVCDDESKKQIVKSPKKNVMSKIKAMIEATSCKTTNKKKPEPEVVVPKRVPSVPKKSRWEAVTSKIAASLAEEKTKPKARREIKGRVDTNLTLARQQVSVCKSPKLDGRKDGTMSPVSVSSRKPLSERNSAPSSIKDDGAGTARDSRHGAKNPRPSRACITSRSNSPVAASESSTSLSLTSHNSKSKIAHWKGSNSTIASSAAPPPSTITVRRQTAVPPSKPPLHTPRTSGQRMVSKKPTTAPRITLQVPGSSRVRPLSPSGKTENREKVLKKEQAGTRGAQLSGGKGGPVRPPMWLSKAELTQEIQRLGTLCEARTKELNRLKMETKHVTVGFDAFAALFKFMVEDLNGLSVPNLTQDLQKTLKQLELTKQDLAYYEKEVEEIKSHHCQELNDLSNKLFEVYQSEVAELNAKHQEVINHMKSDHEIQIELLTATYDTSSAEAKAHSEKMVASMEQEISKQREELQLFQEREIKDLEEKHVEGTKVLQEHVEQLQKKCAELKQHAMSMEDAMRKDTDSKLQWVSAAKSNLEKEVESLKAVLEMKNKELHTLRVQNLEMSKQLEELPMAREKIKMLQARAEDLEALMIEKTNLERKLCTENQVMKDTFEKEAKVNRRLSMENEELQWRLRQAENSIFSGSFSEVSELPEVEENTVATSPTKSPGPHVLSRSVFFTYVDKDESSPHSPRSAYKKITPSFSAGYKTSPAKTSKSPPAPSPRRAKSHSEPPQPVMTTSTPRKNAKLSLNKSKNSQKRQRSESTRQGENTEAGFSSVTDSMTSSISSESSVFEPRERLLDEHRDHIIHSLEILREQRSSEHSTDESTVIEKKWCSDDIQVTTGELSNLRTDDMSRSAEFADPKTYYQMTFAVLKETGDVENSSSGNSPVKEVMSIKHSKSEDNIKSSVESDIHRVQQVMSMSTQEDNMNISVESDIHKVQQVMSMSTQEVNTTSVININKKNCCTELAASAENVQRDSTDNAAENCWRTI